MGRPAAWRHFTGGEKTLPAGELAEKHRKNENALPAGRAWREGRESDAGDAVRERQPGVCAGD